MEGQTVLLYVYGHLCAGIFLGWEDDQSRPPDARPALVDLTDGRRAKALHLGLFAGPEGRPL